MKIVTHKRSRSGIAARYITSGASYPQHLLGVILFTNVLASHNFEQVDVGKMVATSSSTQGLGARNQSQKTT